MDLIMKRLEELGVPRVFRRKVAELLVEKCVEMGERSFREAALRLLEEVVKVATLQDSGSN